MVVPQPQPVPRRQPKSSSERGRAFRTRERERIARLEKEVAALARVVADKTFLRGIWQAKYLRSRHTRHGSLARLVEEYYTVVRDGVHGSSNTTPPRVGVDPVEFLTRVTHSDAVLGDVVGPTGMLDQWIKYTSAYSRCETRMSDLDVHGPEENPTVTAKLHVTVCFTPNTFHIKFPYGLRDPSVAQKLLYREVSFRGTTSLRFSADAQIVWQHVHFDFVEGLLATGISIYDVERLMRAAKISSTCTILDHLPLETQEWSF